MSSPIIGPVPAFHMLGAEWSDPKMDLMLQSMHDNDPCIICGVAFTACTGHETSPELLKQEIHQSKIIAKANAQRIESLFKAADDAALGGNSNGEDPGTSDQYSNFI